VVQGISAELQRMKDLAAQKEEESSAWQAQVESLQKQLAGRSSQVSSPTTLLSRCSFTPDCLVHLCVFMCSPGQTLLLLPLVLLCTNMPCLKTCGIMPEQ